MIDCEVWWAEPVAEPAEFLALLSDAERERYQTYRREPDQRRFLTGRVLAKTIAGQRLGLAAGAVEFDARCADCGRQHGPPRLPGTPLTLSISHSGERIGVALTSGPAVGLDVETASRRADDSLLGYALNDTERAALTHLDPAARADAFFTYWTRKEAVMKATGRGLRIPLRSLTMSGPGEPPRLTRSEDRALAPGRTRMADLDPGEGYRAAVAVLTGDELTVSERWWKPEQGL
ncbi:4'-phosphopantetheinyl transferase family protein [Prauserella muralis]|uniref:4'-phosphopantetheinyl transferase n=1 Tax=Prauserella muralis TaxID=588067 RepID=A0A2V4B9Y9_9PSEU|nr:4'-phosphopantetheinyl transferase superfamily protein [Prauserella muralis]PXY30919.1 4'-phosphopantetheinyl transferase [Prauserella muralis]TWE14831.1 4'-phosphopantetheinyl transferase [Prauserella muralis]